MTQLHSLHVEIFRDADKLTEAAADYIVSVGQEAININGRFVISLSGGHTPEKLFTLLSTPAFRKKLDWKKTFFFWGDERCVPLDDERNNAHQAKLIWLDHMPVPPAHIHRIPVNLPPQDAAIAYQHDIEVFFGSHPKRFDLMLLGLGENGHTASLFPGTPVVHDKDEAVREVYVEEEKLFRVTMTAPLINEARHILFLVTGKNKAIVLEKILNTPFQPDLYPAQLIKSVEGELRWYVDTAAASLLEK
ncbi:MAG: 6-phosphogluconolactonase [Saprospiraceae bacterium]